MAYRLKITTANAGLNAIAALFNSGTLKIYSGTIPTDADTALGAQTLLANIPLPATAFGSASARSVAKSGTWSDSSADAGSSTAPTWFRLANAGDTERIDGTCGVGSGDLNFDGSITTAQVVTVATFVITG